MQKFACSSPLVKGLKSKSPRHCTKVFLVDTGDYGKVAEYMYQLFTDRDLYAEMSEYAAAHVSDEVSTVGNMLSWLYLADTMTREDGKKLETNGAWINDLAREGAGIPYEEGEPRLPRHYKT